MNGVDSNLDSHGASIFLHEIGGVITGSTEALTANVNAGNTIFSIAVSGTGVVTLTQFAQIDHPIADDPTPTATPFEDQLAVLGSGLVTLTGSATITDFDGDTATDSEVVDLGGNIQFADDGPTIDVDDLAVYRTVGTTSGVYDFQVGADVATFDASFGPTALQWTNMPGEFTFELKAGEDHTYVATFDDNGTETTFFEITINDDGTYDFTLVTAQPLEIVIPSGNLFNGITGGSNLPSFTFLPAEFGGAFALELTATRSDTNDPGTARDPATLTISSTELGINGNTIQQQTDERLKLDVQQQAGFENTHLRFTVDWHCSNGQPSSG